MNPTTTRDLFADAMDDAEYRKLIEKGWLADAIVVKLEQKMEELQVTRKELAERMGCKPPNVTRMLRKGTNLTIESIVDMALALHHRFLAPDLVPLSEAAPWETVEVKVQPNVPHVWKAEACGSASSSVTWNYIPQIPAEAAELCPLACR